MTQRVVTSPNFVTFLYIATGVGGAVLFHSNNSLLVYIGLFLIFSRTVFDAWDGRLARLLNKTSVKGAILDPYAGYLCDNAFRTSIIFYAINQNPEYYILFPIAVFIVLFPNIRLVAHASFGETNNRMERANNQPSVATRKIEPRGVIKLITRLYQGIV